MYCVILGPSENATLWSLGGKPTNFNDLSNSLFEKIDSGPVAYLFQEWAPRLSCIITSSTNTEYDIYQIGSQ